MRFLKFFLFPIFVLTAVPESLPAQVIKPIEWQYTVSENEVAAGDTLDLIFRAKIEGEWYLYSSDLDPDLGPMVTTFTFAPGKSYQTVGEIRPIGQKKKYDKIWEGEITFFEETAELRQRVVIHGPRPIIQGSFEYQVCSDIDGKCIPFEEDFVFDNIQVTGEQASDTEHPFASGIQAVQNDNLFGVQQPDGMLTPATWEAHPDLETAEVGEVIDLTLTATIDEGWFLYSSDFTLDPGPMPATFYFAPNETYRLVGDIVPVGANRKYDEVFEGEVTYFTSTAVFRQKIEVLQSDPYVQTVVEYQVCSEEDGKCIPFEEEFEFGQPGEKAAGDDVVSSGTGEQAGGLKSRDTYAPYSLLAFMVVAFLGGLAALFTPCVFPMIPMTVSFFTGRSKDRKQGIRNAAFYGLSIILIYTMIGSLLAPFMGPETANELATNWIPNILFFLIFLIFALSFFGLFEITLPNRWINKMDNQADKKGGLAGIFFMAFTLVLVSFSCTGPIVGSILVESAGGQIIKPVMGMLAFSLAFAIPFTLFAIFPEWLNALPKSGGWLNSVKVVLGFLELALSLKFLSIADQAYHWGILDREVYLAFWIVIFAMLGFYLLGKIRLPGDSPTEVVSVTRLILAVVTFAFVAYMVPGMFGAPLKALAGYLPPQTTHDFDLSKATREVEGISEGGSATMCDPPKFAEILEFPHGLKGYFDYEQAVACARKLNKPVFIDFTGHGCVNCREMEARVWSDPEILRRLRSDYVLLALYVDDKTELPGSMWYTSSYDGKVKKTIGKQNADFQISKFRNNAQPYYILLDPTEEEPLVSPRAYDLDVQEFASFLDSGVQAYYD